MTDFIVQPLPGIVIYLILMLLDYPLTAISRSSYQKYLPAKIKYPLSITQSGIFHGTNGLIKKFIMAIIFYMLWLISAKYEFSAAGMAYRWLLGFCIGLFLVISLYNLTITSVSRFWARLKINDESISTAEKFLFKVFAVQLLASFTLLTLYVLIEPGCFALGLACSALLLVARNCFFIFKLANHFFKMTVYMSVLC